MPVSLETIESSVAEVIKLQREVFQDYKNIIVRIEALEKTVNILITIITQTHVSFSESIKELTKLVYQHNEQLNGSGGLSIRMERLEDLEKAKRWTWKAMIATTIGFVFKLVHDFVRGR